MEGWRESLWRRFGSQAEKQRDEKSMRKGKEGEVVSHTERERDGVRQRDFTERKKRSKKSRKKKMHRTVRERETEGCKRESEKNVETEECRELVSLREVKRERMH